MTGLIVTTTGWTIRELDDTPWPEIADLLDYWHESPPVHLLMKADMKYEPQEPEEARPMNPEELRAWVARINRS